jgi:hypothetical protein
LKENGFEDLIRQRVKGGHGGKELSVVTAKEYRSFRPGGVVVPNRDLVGLPPKLIPPKLGRVSVSCHCVSSLCKNQVNLPI